MRVCVCVCVCVHVLAVCVSQYAVTLHVRLKVRQPVFLGDRAEFSYVSVGFLLQSKDMHVGGPLISSPLNHIS